MVEYTYGRVAGGVHYQLSISNSSILIEHVSIFLCLFYAISFKYGVDGELFVSVKPK